METVGTASAAALRAQYRDARARLMGQAKRTPGVPARPAGAADAAPPAATVPSSGPASWLAELIAFNEQLRRLFLRQTPAAALPLGERIRTAVASHYGITVAEICGDGTTRRCAWPRQVGMYICAREAGLGTLDIALLFGKRNPSTVHAAVRAVMQRAGRDRAFEQKMSALIAACRRGARP